ncbi:MAG TPA: endonuclease III [Gemmatimonadales bacterium]
MKAGGQARGKRPKESLVKQVVKKVLGKTARGQSRKSARPPVRPPAAEIISILKETYPDARCALEHRNAYELLCATILSAQCTDARVNLVTPALFTRYPTPFELARAEPADVEEIIKSTGFFRNKTKSLIGMAQAVVADHGGEVPRTMEELRQLPGVGRKTANVVLSNAYGTNEGVTVDTHVTRLSGLLGLTRDTDPVRIEEDLMRLYPREDWGILSHLLIFHGRQVCIARRPRCGECVLARLCPSSLV